MKPSYISDDEIIKCRKVKEAFTELYEIENIVVVEVGRYGFVKLQYYKEPDGFQDMETFTDSKKLFENLWQEWLDTKLYLMAKGTPMAMMSYEEVFDCLQEDQKQELMSRKIEFAEKAEMK